MLLRLSRYMMYNYGMANTDKRYVNILFDDDTLRAIDDFRFKNRFESRTEAIRWLIAFALKQKPRKEV